MTAREYMAQRLREFRLDKGLNVDEVGSSIGKSGKTISAWEVGRGQPDADKLVDLCRLYDARISDFYSDDVSRDVTLSNDEEELLIVYRSMNETGKHTALSVVTALAKSGDYEP